MVGRIVRTADFERVLGQAPRSRSAHFAVHHVAARPAAPSKGRSGAVEPKLSTGDALTCPPPVDDLPTDCWLGTVVPKRHARRSVTRNLLKRQMREVMQREAAALPGGLWVLRLKSPFDPRQFSSPASVPLRQAARDELTVLLQRAAKAPPAGPARPR
ncbi:ribonuclease P protein component [Ideonella sp. A 288]|uniref:ribonuclease P protein component n=1 Tax=Ideonella sp. A 288 TaxID=1962181 RepID=UPI000B4BC282|nr:ribonuclease P protein component [Ideonella sp. A 288]